MDTIYRPQTLACGHLFCESCVRQAKATVSAPAAPPMCPVCRSAPLDTAVAAPQTRQVLLTWCPAKYRERRSEAQVRAAEEAAQRKAAMPRGPFHYGDILAST